MTLVLLERSVRLQNRYYLGQGRVREGSGVGFWVRLFVRVSLQGLYGRVSFKG